MHRFACSIEASDKKKRVHGSGEVEPAGNHIDMDSCSASVRTCIYGWHLQNCTAFILNSNLVTAPFILCRCCCWCYIALSFRLHSRHECQTRNSHRHHLNIIYFHHHTLAAQPIPNPLPNSKQKKNESRKNRSSAAAAAASPISFWTFSQRFDSHFSHFFLNRISHIAFWAIAFQMCRCHCSTCTRHRNTRWQLYRKQFDRNWCSIVPTSN